MLNGVCLSEHNIEERKILFHKIANITSYFPRKYRKAKIQKHSNNLNRDNGYNINKIWKTIFPVMEDRPIFPIFSPPPHHSNKQCNIKGMARRNNIRLLFTLVKWIVRFTKRWYSKNGSGRGENSREKRITFI